MTIPTIALLPPKPKLEIRPRRLTVDVCPACQRPLNELDECRCTA